MLRKYKFELAVIVASIIFILVNAFLTYQNKFFLNAIPLLLFIISLFIFAPSKIFLLIVFLVPLSIPLRRIIPGLSFDFWMPTEPLIFGLLLIIVLKSFKERYFDKKLLNHPIFWMIIFHLGWIFISIIPSSIILVSVKYFFVRIWFIGVFFLLGYYLFKSNINNFKYFLWLFVAGMFVVSILTLVKHSGIGLFNQKAAHGACTPFFIDHTSYGATIAFTLTMLLGLYSFTKSKFLKGLILVLFIYFSFALIFSYSRAAWLSVFFALLVWGLWFLRIRIRTVFIALLLVFGTFWLFNQEIGNWLHSNKTESSGNLKEHLNSMINVRTDASNLERINRWNAAIRMFKERPLYGWGPGTYAFLYAPFQRSYQKTIISTNFGTGGNAHSEYLGLLSESGLPSAITYILILILVIYKGLKISRDPKQQNKIVVLSCVLGIITYTVHGAMNNFLDSDKIAVPFWTFIALIVAMDIKPLEEEENQKLGEFKA